MCETSDKKCIDDNTSDITYVDDNTSGIDDETSDEACKSIYAHGARKK